MVTFIWSTNASLPKISYVKGIDVYLVTCFFMTFLSVIEYATVSFIHNHIERIKKKDLLQTQQVQQVKQPSHMQQIMLMQNNSNPNNTYK